MEFCWPSSLSGSSQLWSSWPLSQSKTVSLHQEWWLTAMKIKQLALLTVNDYSSYIILIYVSASSGKRSPRSLEGNITSLTRLSRNRGLKCHRESGHFQHKCGVFSSSVLYYNLTSSWYQTYQLILSFKLTLMFYWHL